MSRVHGHFSIIPELDGKLNAKKIETRREMNVLNNAINKMTIEKYNVCFLTGEKKRSKGSVEDCKRKSNEEERKHIKNAKKALSTQIADLKTKPEKLQDLKIKLSQKQKEPEIKEEINEVDIKDSEIAKLRKKISCWLLF